MVPISNIFQGSQKANAAKSQAQGSFTVLTILWY